ncbi:hypothetical protein Tco_1071191 [Tanacetum coccineum]|uniref:Uncharacterized protein n=1 Tax=Tanacetum coccineum TaxID=301880 RepID=A0ABQ5HPY0_9ASTR
MKMEILLESTSNNLLVGSHKVGDGDGDTLFEQRQVHYRMLILDQHIQRNHKSSSIYQEKYEHVGPQDTRPQDGKRSQDDDQRLDLADDLMKAQDHISSLNTCHKTKTTTSKERILKDHWRDRFGDEEDDLKENLEDLEECEEDKAIAIIGAIHDKLNDDWFNNTSEDEDDLEGILDYLEPRSYDGFIDLDDEAYNKRRCRLLEMTYKEPTPILMEKVKVTRYTIGPGWIYTKVKVLGVDEIPRTRDNVAAIRAKLMEKVAHKGNGQANT